MWEAWCSCQRLKAGKSKSKPSCDGLCSLQPVNLQHSKSFGKLPKVSHVSLLFKGVEAMLALWLPSSLLLLWLCWHQRRLLRHWLPLQLALWLLL